MEGGAASVHEEHDKRERLIEPVALEVAKHQAIDRGESLRRRDEAFVDGIARPHVRVRVFLALLAEHKRRIERTKTTHGALHR